MFFRFTNEEIQDSKNTIFPLLEDYELSSFIVNSNNNSNLINLSITLRDSYTQPKVFGVLTAKKYMKIKIFEITNQKLKTDIKNVDSFTKLNKIILDNKLNHVDVSAGYGFNGNNSNKSHHYVQNNYLLLNYDIQYSTNNNLNNYSIGIVFYYDYGDYKNDVDVSFKSTENLFFNNIKVIDIYQNSKILTFSGVQDLRVVNELFNKSYSENIILQQEGFSKKIKLLSEKQFKNIKLGQYFSNAYFSRKTNGHLGFLFNFNKYKFLKESSQYINNFIDSPLGEQYINQSKISSIKILRRQVDKNKKPIFDSVERTYSKLIESGQIGNFIKEKNDDFGSIKQLDLITDNTTKISTFEISDKTIFSNTAGYYQYGVQISILDGFTDYLNSIVELLNLHNKKIKNYLEQTNKTITTSNEIFNFNPHNEKKILNLNGYYDSVNNKFTNYFSSFVYPQNFERDLLNAVNLIISVVKFFNKSINEEKVILSLINLINPSVATSSTINYFLQLHTKFINNINMLLKNNNNSFIELEHWFTNETVDCNEKINIGYTFLNLDSEDGLGNISGLTYKNKVLNDIKRYSFENSLFQEQKNKSTAFLGIESINSKNFSLNIKNIDNNVDYYDPFNYAEIELDIKNYIFNNEQDRQSLISTKSNALKPEIQTLKQKLNLFFNKINIVNSNSFTINDDSKNQRINNNSNTIEDNNLNDPTLLFLALAKNVDLQKNTFKNSTIVKNSIDITDPKYTELLNQLPYQLELVFRSKSKIFTNDFKYLNDLALNSKFLLLFNTIHKVEILNYENSNVKNENWRPLTLDIIDSLDGADNYLCRLSPCNGETFNLKNFIDIKLPIYNKYFLLKDINGLKSVSVNTILIPKENNALSLNRQLINTQPVVERYARSYQNIPVFSPPPFNPADNPEDQQVNGSGFIPPEDQPHLLQDQMLVPNEFTLAFEYPEAKELVLQSEIFAGDPNNPNKICGPNLVYKVSDGKNGYKNPPPQLFINTFEKVIKVSGDTVTVENFGAKETGENFVDGRIYKISYIYNKLKDLHLQKGGEIQAAIFADSIKSKDEVDALDTINEFGQRVLGFGRHYSIGNNQRLGRGNIGTGQHFQLKSKNGIYVFSIDITMKEFKIMNLQNGKILWRIKPGFVAEYKYQKSTETGRIAGSAGFIPGILIGGAVGAVVGIQENELQKNGISDVYFNDGQLQIFSDLDKTKIFMQFGPFTPDDKESYMILQDDGNLVIYNKNGISTWESRTYGDNDSYGPSNLVAIKRSDGNIDYGTAPEVYLEGMWGADSSKIVSLEEYNQVTGGF